MGDDAKPRIYAKAVEEFIDDNKKFMTDEAINLLKAMEDDDQKRVLSGGPLDISHDIGYIFRTRMRAQREREEEMLNREGKDIKKPASKENMDQWIAANKKYLSEAGLQEFTSLDPFDQWRVISGGPLGENMDAACVIETRATRGRSLADSLIALMSQKSEAAKKQEQKNQLKLKANTPDVANAITDRFTRYVGKEVPAHLRRCGGYAGEATWEEKPILTGKVRGVGGVVEALKSKYGMQKGERLEVIGDKGGAAGMWLLKGGKSVPKLHEKQGGWKWILDEEAMKNDDDVIKNAKKKENGKAEKGDETKKDAPNKKDTEETPKNASRSRSRDQHSKASEKEARRKPSRSRSAEEPGLAELIAEKQRREAEREAARKKVSRSRSQEESPRRRESVKHGKRKCSRSRSRDEAAKRKDTKRRVSTSRSCSRGRARTQSRSVSRARNGKRKSVSAKARRSRSNSRSPSVDRRKSSRSRVSGNRKRSKRRSRSCSRSRHRR